MPTEEQVKASLKNIPDPEIGISIVDLGLIYGTTIDPKTKKVTVRLTLTSVGCPLFEQIAIPVKNAVRELDGVEDVEVELTFDPPWSVDLMSDEAKMQLGFL